MASTSRTAGVALFYKDMEKPIERVVQLASGTAGNSEHFEMQIAVS